MIVTANTNFAGVISMTEGEQRDIPEGDILSDLLRCGYVTEKEHIHISEVATDDTKSNNVRKRKAGGKD